MLRLARYAAGLGKRGLRTVWVGRARPVAPPTGAADPAAVDLSVHEWSVYRSVLRGRFDVVEVATGKTPGVAYLTMGGTTLRVPLRRDRQQRLEIALPANHEAATMALQFKLASGEVTAGVEPAEYALAGDAGGDLLRRFIA